MIIHTDPNTLINQPKEATMQEPTPTPTPAFDLNGMFLTFLTQAVMQANAPLLARIDVLERSLVVADKAAQGNESDLYARIAALETRIDGATLTPLTHEYIAKVARESVEVSEERIKEIADEVARDVLNEHTEEYDHDGYDRLEDKLDDKVNEAIDEYDFEDKISEAINGLTFNLRVA